MCFPNISGHINAIWGFVIFLKWVSLVIAKVIWYQIYI